MPDAFSLSINSETLATPLGSTTFQVIAFFARATTTALIVGAVAGAATTVNVPLFVEEWPVLSVAVIT